MQRGACRQTRGVVHERVRFTVIVCLHFRPSPFRQNREYKVYRELLRIIPSLEERSLSGSEEEALHIANLVHLCTSLLFPDDFLTCSNLDPKGLLKC
jgi:hypothetical protein